jgi:hypothetical protein
VSEKFRYLHIRSFALRFKVIEIFLDREQILKKWIISNFQVIIKIF